jgi:hypothetical protein
MLARAVPYGPTRPGERRVLLGDAAQQAADALLRDVQPGFCGEPAWTPKRYG